MAGRVAYHGGLVTDGLVLHLDAARKPSYPGSGDVWYDISGNGNNGTLYNSITYNKDRNNGAFVFDGTYEYFNFPEISFTNQAFTLEFWGSMTNFDSRRTIFIGDYPGELSFNYVYFTALTEDGVTNYRNFGAGNWPYLVPTGAPFMWTFVHYPNRTSTFAVNGNLNPLDSDDLSAPTDVTFKFNGFGRQSSRPYYGDLYSAKIYNRALSASEVLQNYNALKGRFGL